MKEFDGDDHAYLSWINLHPEGFVLNVRRHPDPDYVVLHRATCGTISSSNLKQGAYTERNYRKWCAESINELKSAARKEGRIDGSFSKKCGRCFG